MVDAHPHSFPLESVTETKVKIDGIQSETDGLKVAFKDVIECPCEVSIHREMVESTPCSSYLCTPLEVAECR